MLAPFCGDTLAVLLAQIKSWVDAGTQSEFFKIVVTAARKSGHDPRERLTRLQVFRLRERRSWGGVTGASTRESHCWSGRSRVALPEVEMT